MGRLAAALSVQTAIAERGLVNSSTAAQGQGRILGAGAAAILPHALAEGGETLLLGVRVG